MGTNKDGKPRRTYDSGYADGVEATLGYLQSRQGLVIKERPIPIVAAPPGMVLDEHGAVRPLYKPDPGDE